jgi:excisionase family DNA binding protein
MKVITEQGTHADDEPADVGVVQHRVASDAEYPLTVREAARFLGVSPQTVHLWVERKQIPHLRVMGRNIRFLKSDLEPFRSRFKQEVEDGTTT